MPTYEPLPRFWRDFDRLTEQQRAAFMNAVELFREGLETGRFHPSLAVHRIDRAPGVYALSWGAGNDGRATFQYGRSRRSGEPHIVWRRIGAHDIYRRP